VDIDHLDHLPPVNREVLLGERLHTAPNGSAQRTFQSPLKEPARG
jgi:hypothetical protein